MTQPAADERSDGWAPEDVALYEAQAPRLLALAAALAGPSNADDIVSAAVIRSFTTPCWAEVTNPSAYLTRAVINEVKTGHRTAMRRSAREDRYVRSDQAVHVDADPVPELLAALAALPIQQRAVTFLTYWGDLNVAGVAVELGISEGSVRKYLARARTTLRRRLR
jgi:RNA polymerase sigma factor (sigma-70 family)